MMSGPSGNARATSTTCGSFSAALGRYLDLQAHAMFGLDRVGAKPSSSARVNGCYPRAKLALLEVAGCNPNFMRGD